MGITMKLNNNLVKQYVRMGRRASKSASEESNHVSMETSNREAKAGEVGVVDVGP